MPGNTSQTRNTIKLDDCHKETMESSTISPVELIVAPDARNPEQHDGSGQKQKVAKLVSSVLQKIETQSAEAESQTEARHDTYVYQGRIIRLSDSEENELYTR